MKFDNNTVYFFNKGYNDYKDFKHFTDNKTGFKTRIKDNAVYEELEIKKNSWEHSQWHFERKNHWNWG